MTPVLMWEARAVDGARERLLAWVRDRADELMGGAERRELFVADGGRVVLIAVGPDLPGLPEPPDDLVARPPHAWTFTRVDPPDRA